jgi:hypothetical protein
MRRSLFKLYFPWKGAARVGRKEAIAATKVGVRKDLSISPQWVGAEIHESLKSVDQNFWLITRLTQNLSGLYQTVPHPCTVQDTWQPKTTSSHANVARMTNSL